MNGCPLPAPGSSTRCAWARRSLHTDLLSLVCLALVCATLLVAGSSSATSTAQATSLEAKAQGLLESANQQAAQAVGIPGLPISQITFGTIEGGQHIGEFVDGSHGGQAHITIDLGALAESMGKFWQPTSLVEAGALETILTGILAHEYLHMKGYGLDSDPVGSHEEEGVCEHLAIVVWELNFLCEKLCVEKDKLDGEIDHAESVMLDRRVTQLCAFFCATLNSLDLDTVQGCCAHYEPDPVGTLPGIPGFGSDFDPQAEPANSSEPKNCSGASVLDWIKCGCCQGGHACG